MGDPGAPPLGKDEPEPQQTLLERAGDAAAGVTKIGEGNPRRRAFIQYGIALLIFGSLIGFVIGQAGKLPDYDWHFEPAWLAASLVGVIVFYECQSTVALWTMRSLGVEIHHRPWRAIWAKSILARYVPTNLLMVVGRAAMCEKRGIPLRITLASVVYELTIAFGTAVAVGAYVVIDLPDLEGVAARWAVLGVIPAFLLALHPRVFGPLSSWALRKVGREPLPEPLGFGRVLELCAAYTVTWFIIGGATYAFAAALHPVDASDIVYVAAAYPMSYGIAVLTFVLPSGIGARDVALATSMSAVLPSAVATAIAVGFRLAQTAIELAWIGWAVVWDRRRPEGPPAT